MYNIGIDPGLGGAISFISDNEILLKDMPIKLIPWVKTSKYKNMVDTVELWNMLNEYEINKINIEVVHAMPKQGPSSTWAFAGAFYSAVSIVSLMDVEVNMIFPQQWKKKFGLINMPKDASRVVALNMYPHLLPLLKRKKDVDRADALFIGAY